MLITIITVFLVAVALFILCFFIISYTFPLMRLYAQALIFNAKGEYMSAIATIDEMIDNKLKPSEETFLINAIVLKEEILKLLLIQNYEGFSRAMIIDNCDALINKFINDNSSKIKKSVLMSMQNKNSHLMISEADELLNPTNEEGAQSYVKQRLAANDALIERYGDDQEDFVGSYVLSALKNKGEILTELEDFESAFTAFEDFEQKFEQCGRIDSHTSDFIHGMVSKATSLHQCGHSKLALATFDDLFARYKDNYLADIESNIILYVDLLTSAKRYQEALTYCNKITAALAPQDERYLTRAYIGKAAVLEKMGKSQEAIEVYDAFISRLTQEGDEDEDEDEDEIDYSYLYSAYIGKVLILEEMGRTGEAEAIMTVLTDHLNNTIYDSGIEDFIEGHTIRETSLKEMGIFTPATKTSMIRKMLDENKIETMD